MPIYEYECSGCGAHFERRQRFDEEPVGVCPTCQGKVRRIIQSVPVVFKGSGFYVTDYPKSGGGGCEPNNKKKDEDKKTEDKPSENKKPDEKKSEPVSTSTKKDSEN